MYVECKRDNHLGKLEGVLHDMLHESTPESCHSLISVTLTALISRFTFRLQLGTNYFTDETFHN